MPGIDPHLGIFHLVLDWREFGQRPIAVALEKSGTLVSLPGKEAGVEVWSVIEKLFGHIYAPPSDDLLVTLPDHVRGVPINHKRRVVEFLRLRRSSRVDPSVIDTEKLKESLNESFRGTAHVTEFQCESFEAFRQVNRYAMFVEPPFEMSTRDCITLIKDRIARVFDSLEDRKCEKGCDTQGVLSIDGQIEFERK